MMQGTINIKYAKISFTIFKRLIRTWTTVACLIFSGNVTWQQILAICSFKVFNKQGYDFVQDATIVGSLLPANCTCGRIQYSCTVHHKTSSSHQFEQGIPQAIMVKKKNTFQVKDTTILSKLHFTGNETLHKHTDVWRELVWPVHILLWHTSHFICCHVPQCGSQTLGSLLYFFWLKFHLFSGPTLRFTLQSLVTFFWDLCSSGILCRVYW